MHISRELIQDTCQNYGYPSAVRSSSTRYGRPGKGDRYVLLTTSILGRLWLEKQGPSRSAIAVAVATAPIATSTTSPALIQAEGLNVLLEFLGAGLVAMKCIV